MAITFQLSCALVLALVQPMLGASNSFNYHVSDTKHGPLGWAKTYPNFCNRSSQSPINIVTSNTEYDTSLDQLPLTKFDAVPTGEKFNVVNNGHTYVVSFTPNTFLVSGGGLPGTFTTLQFHFHWGSDDTKGSEHTVDGRKYPAELHFVNYNKKYPSITEAVKHEDGLAVLGVIFKVGAENPALTSFLKYALNVTQPSNMSGISMTHNLQSLLPSNSTTDFYRYKGSLTTPACNEVVTWTVFKNYATISKAQLNMLRSLKENATTALTDTFRPVQPLNSRVVKRSFKTAADKGPENESRLVTATMTTILSAVMVMAAVLL